MAGSSAGQPVYKTGTGIGQIAPTANQNIYQQAQQGLARANQATTAGTNFSPMAITAPTTATMDKYNNPYETGVIDQNLADIERSRLLAQNQMGASATAANAFGGSRHGIAQAESNTGFAERAAAMSGQLRQQGYSQAQQMARQAQMANQQAQMAGQAQRMGSANQLGNLANMGFGMGQTMNNQMNQQGTQQQALQQAIIDSAKQRYQGYVNAPQQALNLPLTALGAAPYPQSEASSKGYSPGLFDYLTLGAKAASGTNFGG
jgi:hypothetical protein